MATPNRAALINKTHKVLKQHYKPVTAQSDRPLLQHMLFACCLENAPYEMAEKVFAHLQQTFFDWNEVRVSTVSELAEVMSALPYPAAAAANLKKVLQSVFESTYSFDIESMKKLNIGQGIKKLERMDGSTPFVVGYVTQAALGGHSIPLDRGGLQVLAVLGIITPSEAQSGNVTGLERTIGKNKGVEFGSLLHQIGADYLASPFSPQVRKILLSISPSAKDRFPKRGAKKEEEPVAEVRADDKGKKAQPTAGAGKKSEPAKPHTVPAKGAAKAEKKPAPTAKKPNAAKRPDRPAKSSGKSHVEKRKTATKQLAKRKPR